MREITGNSEVKRVTFTVIQGCQNWYQVRMQFHTNSVGDVATQNPKSAFLRYFYSPQSRLRASFGLIPGNCYALSDSENFMMQRSVFPTLIAKKIDDLIRGTQL